MKRIFLIKTAYILLSGLFATGWSQSYTKLAQTGFQFLSVVSDARIAALGGAVTGVELQSSSLFCNPAGMANQPTFLSVSAGQNHWIADIDHNTLSLAVNPASGRYGVMGVSVQSVDYGELLGTRVSDNEQGYIDTGVFKPSAIAVGVGYAKALTDRFSVGGQIKVVRQRLGDVRIPVTDSTTTTIENELTPLAFDFGTLFKTGFKSLTFGMSVRNFSREIEFEEEGFQLPLVFRMGISINLFDLRRVGDLDHSLVLSVDATHYRSHPEQLIVGLEYRLLKLLSLRGGYVSNNDEDDFSLGFGVSHYGITLDYAYTPFGVFDNVQRITARFAI